ncbi:MAG TPA: glycosyl hydrolase family 28-related protein [Verrucomicrobiae bacterium]
MSPKLCLAFALCALHGCAPFAAEPSDLWGQHGEKWNPQSRLPDFSHAGYHEGGVPLPDLPPGASVKDFGAKGDGVADDTQAFLDALAQVKSGAIEIPAGRYKITKILEITRPGLVLRGAGADRTFLFFPTPLNDIRPHWSATTDGTRTSDYSWAGGLVWIKGTERGQALATVTAGAKRGDTSLKVSATDKFKPGQRIEIFMSDADDKSLVMHLYSGDPGRTDKMNPVRVSFVARVTRVEPGEVHFDRPLRWAVETKWQPRISSFDPSVTECGVEKLCFEFPNTPYRGHFTEAGYNAVAINNAADCWVRGIRVVNPDSGLFVRGRFCTVQGVVFQSERQPEKDRGATGHHGLCFEGSDDLALDFDFQTKFMHDITVDHQAAGNVCARGRGVDICFDHHKDAPYENLFTDIDIGLGTRPWQCGGGEDLGKNSGARETFWNIRSRRPISYPPSRFGPASMNLAGLQSDGSSVKEMDGKWFECIPPAALQPQNLYNAQLARRLHQP